MKACIPWAPATMKYNPKVNEAAARLPGFARLHPLQDPATVQGAMALLFGLQHMIAEIGGFHSVSLQPSAGAHGELTGILIMRAWHAARGDGRRTRILVPDSAHGTNPASTTMAGLEVVEIPSDPRGNVDLIQLRAHLDSRVAGLMLTNPNTLGLFDENLLEITRLVHEAGGLVYGDGANFNAILGVAKPGLMGIGRHAFQLAQDLLHAAWRRRPRFWRGRRGGGAGRVPPRAAGRASRQRQGDPVRVEHPEKYDRPREKFPRKLRGARPGIYLYPHARARRAARVAENAVLNANYLQARLKDTFPVPHGDRTCMHEFVAREK